MPSTRNQQSFMTAKVGTRHVPIPSDLVNWKLPNPVLADIWHVPTGKVVNHRHNHHKPKNGLTGISTKQLGAKLLEDQAVEISKAQNYFSLYTLTCKAVKQRAQRYRMVLQGKNPDSHLPKKETR